MSELLEGDVPCAEIGDNVNGIASRVAVTRMKQRRELCEEYGLEVE